MKIIGYLSKIISTTHISAVNLSISCSTFTLDSFETLYQLSENLTCWDLRKIDFTKNNESKGNRSKSLKQWWIEIGPPIQNKILLNFWMKTARILTTHNTNSSMFWLLKQISSKIFVFQGSKSIDIWTFWLPENNMTFIGRQPRTYPRWICPQVALLSH